MMDGKMTADQDPLFAAVAAGRVDVVEAFLASGVSADHRAKDPEAADITHTPLGFARLRWGWVVIIRINETVIITFSSSQYVKKIIITHEHNIT